MLRVPFSIWIDHNVRIKEKHNLLLRLNFDRNMLIFAAFHNNLKRSPLWPSARITAVLITQI